MENKDHKFKDACLRELMHRGSAFVLFQKQCETRRMFVQQHGEVQRLPSIASIDAQQGFLFVPFHPTSQTPILLLAPDTDLVGDEAISHYLLSMSPSIPVGDEDPLVSGDLKRDSTMLKDDYRRLFQLFIDPLEAGAFSKLVLSRSIRLPLPAEALAPFSLFENCCKHYPNAYKYLFYSPSSGLWLGASPELMLQKKGDEYITQSLAGTMIYADGDRLSRWSPLIRKEQQLVTDFICSQLSSLQLETDCGAPTIEKAGALAHISTSIAFKNGHYPIGELLEQLYPTPAICGLPKEEAKAFILQHETNDRSYYSGIIGHLDPAGDVELFVNLRCLSADKQGIRLYAGSGLLAGSQCEEEWSETENKLETMRKLFD